MDPVLAVALAFAGFAAGHIGLAWPPLRRVLVARLGRWGFTLGYSLVAWISFGFAVTSYAARAAEGPAGPGLGGLPALRFALIALIVAGAMLMTGAFAGYGQSPFSPTGAAAAPSEPRGLARITRHPFFIGVALLGGAHALLATRLTGSVLMGGLALFALAGARFQDSKLRALRGEPYAAYCAASSILPFAAIAAGRQRLVLSELPFGLLGLGAALAWLLRAVHPQLFAHGGAYLIAALVLGPLVILGVEWRRDRRAGGERTPAAAAS